MRYKSWPYYDDWNIIFGKDRALGGRVEGMGQAFKRMGAGPHMTPEPPADVYNVNLDDLFTEDEINGSVNPEIVAESCIKSVKSPTTLNTSTRKRKTRNAMDSILKAILKMNNDTNNHIQTLSTLVGYDFDLSTKRTEVSRLLRAVLGLDKKQKFLAGDILVKEPRRLDFFMGLEEDEKTDYVMHIVEEKHGS